MSESEKVTMHRVAVDMYKMEKDQYWIRTNIFLLINSALMVAFTSDRAGKALQLLISATAVTLCISWIAISLHSEYYIKRWREIIRNIETDLITQPFLSFPKDGVVFSNRASTRVLNILLSIPRWFAQGGPSRIMHAVIVLLCALWVSLAVSNVLGVQLRDVAPSTDADINRQKKDVIESEVPKRDPDRQVESQIQITALLKATSSTLDSMQAHIKGLVSQMADLEKHSARNIAALRRVRMPEDVLTRGDWLRIQSSLLSKGFDVGPIDGMPGPRTRSAIAAMQTQLSTRSDGHLSLEQFTDLDQPSPSD